MDIVIVSKETSKAVHSYYDTAIKVKRGYPLDDYAYAEIEADKDWLGYYWDGNAVAYDANLVPQPDPIEQIRSTYSRHKQNGANYFDLKRAQLVYKYMTGELSVSEVYYIEEKIREVKLLVTEGDWMTGLNELNKTTVWGAYTSSVKNEYKTEIEDYIAKNYS